MEWKELLCSDRIRNYQTSKTTGDLRTEFEKDYHRIINSASFRRLQDKTQVFPLDRSDFVRTRLTHSLEVSSFCKSLGQNIGEKIQKEVSDPAFRPEYKAHICDILQCAGLLHDIGNPPFGHFGETVIREWFIENLPEIKYFGRTVASCFTPQMCEDFYHFEGNTQALRLVCKLHFLVDEHGMNLTKALLGTIIKYPVSSLAINKNSGNIKDKKMGYYFAEASIFQDIQNTLKTCGCRHPLTYVLEAADDIAYKTADIEDAFKKGCISYSQLIEELERRQDKGEAFDQMIEVLKRYYRRAVEKGRKNPEMYAVQNWTVHLQGRLIFSAAEGFISNYDSIMAGTYGSDIFAGTDGCQMMEALGEIAYNYAFNIEPILKLEIAAEKMIGFLLDQFTAAVIYYDTDKKLSALEEKRMALISENYLSIYHYDSKGKDEIEKLYLRFLLVTDFVCGMTDSYAKALYQELNGID